MIEFRTDLHCHSTCSDGTLTPTEIVHLAYEKKLSGLSITDHDTIAAYEEALPVADSCKIPMVTGAEFSAVHEKTNVHILAYSFSSQSALIQDFCRMHCQRRTLRNQIILDLLASKGMPIDEHELGKSTPSAIIGRPHIAIAMIKKGYVKTIQEAFHSYIGEGKPCYFPGEKISVEETLDYIHQAKGLAVIAHPHLINNTKIIRGLLDLNFDGIEAYYGRFPPSEHERWVKIGARKGWVITGGSDFHGAIKPNLPLGCSWTNEETFSILYRHYLQNQI